jgi:hypothetical protein
VQQIRNKKMKKIITILLLILFSYSTSFSQIGNPDYFPIAVWLQSPSRAQEYKDAGINLYVGLWNELNQAQLDDLKDAGMYVICNQNEFGLSLGNDSTISGWVHGDEPDNAQWNSDTQKYDPCIDPAEIISYYNLLKSNDPTRPVYLNLGRGVSHLNWGGRGTCTGNFNMYKEENDGYIAGCDIISFDIYPVNDKDTVVSEKLWYVPKGIDSLISWSVNPKPTWCWIETTKIQANNNRQPTPEEVKSEVWMAIIHGATGIGYFCHSWAPSFDEAALLHDSIMIKAVADLNFQISSLAPVLNSQTIENYTNAESSNPDIPVDVMTKSTAGNEYIFAAAMRPGTTEATFEIPDDYPLLRVEVLNENRFIDIVGGQFKDSFSNYESHIYKLSYADNIIQNLYNDDFLNIYPNPASDYIEIKAEVPLLNISIYNPLGQCIMTVADNAGSKLRKIDISHLPSGTYLCVISNAGDLCVEKFIVME